jgi:hypothetical protein
LYPSLIESRGVRETTVGLAQARMTGVVRAMGSRPLNEVELGDWRQRSRERSVGPDRSDRSR